MNAINKKTLQRLGVNKFAVLAPLKRTELIHFFSDCKEIAMITFEDTENETLTILKPPRIWGTELIEKYDFQDFFKD